MDNEFEELQKALAREDQLLKKVVLIFFSIVLLYAGFLIIVF